MEAIREDEVYARAAGASSSSDSPYYFPPPPKIEPTFNVSVRAKLKNNSEETMRKSAEKAAAAATKSSGGAGISNLLAHRAKYIRQTTPDSGVRTTRILLGGGAAHLPTNPNPRPVSCALPAIQSASMSAMSDASVTRLYSPRSFDRPKMKGGAAPPDRNSSEPDEHPSGGAALSSAYAASFGRLSTPDFKAAIDAKLGPEARLMWDTIALAKRSYAKEYSSAFERTTSVSNAGSSSSSSAGGGKATGPLGPIPTKSGNPLDKPLQGSGLDRALAERYLRYIHGSVDYSDDSLKKYMAEAKRKREEAAAKKVVVENDTAATIRVAMEAEVVGDIRFHPEHLPASVLLSLIFKSASTADHLAIFLSLLDEVAAELLVDLLPGCLTFVDDETVQREADRLRDFDSRLAVLTLRQLREELRRYGVTEKDERLALEGVKVPNGSQGMRGILRKKALVVLLADQKRMHGELDEGKIIQYQALTRPWTRILRTGTPTDPNANDPFARNMSHWEKKRLMLDGSIGLLDGGDSPSDDLLSSFIDEDNTPGLESSSSQRVGGGSSTRRRPPPAPVVVVVVDPYVRNRLVAALLARYPGAAELRTFMNEQKMSTETPGLKGEERRVKLANNVVDDIAKNDDVFRAWKAVLLSGGHKIESDASDDILSVSNVLPSERGLTVRGGSSRRRTQAAASRRRPNSSNVWRKNVTPDSDGFYRPGTDSYDKNWLKRRSASSKSEEFEWHNRVTGDVVPIKNFFSPEHEPGGWGRDYLERLLTSGVSIPFSNDPSDNRSAAHDPHGFERGTADKVHELKTEMRKKSLLRPVDDSPGSYIAYQRSLLQMKRQLQKHQDYLQRIAENRSNLTIQQISQEVEEDEDSDSEMSDIDFFAEYVVQQIERSLPQFLFEEGLLRFGAGPPKPPSKASKNAGVAELPCIQFRDEDSRVMEEFVFYFEKIEIPVAKLKALVLRELVHRFKERSGGGESESKFSRGSQCQYFDSEEMRFFDVTVAKISFDVEYEEVLYTVIFLDGEHEGEERQTNQHHLLPLSAEKKKKAELAVSDAPSVTARAHPSPKSDATSNNSSGAENDAPPLPKFSSETAVSSTEATQYPPVPSGRLQWTRHTDDDGYVYYYNKTTNESTYTHPFRNEEDEDDEAEAEAEAEEADSDDEDEKARFAEHTFDSFCAILIQKMWRARNARNRCRVVLAKSFVKKYMDGVGYVYEEVHTKEVFYQRPVIFSRLFKTSNF